MIPHAASGWTFVRSDLARSTFELSAEDLAELQRAMPPDAAAGERYPVYGLASLDSER
jgi:hypothetical protein